MALIRGITDPYATKSSSFGAAANHEPYLDRVVGKWVNFSTVADDGVHRVALKGGKFAVSITDTTNGTHHIFDAKWDGAGGQAPIVTDTNMESGVSITVESATDDSTVTDGNFGVFADSEADAGAAFGFKNALGDAYKISVMRLTPAQSY